MSRMLCIEMGSPCTNRLLIIVRLHLFFIFQTMEFLACLMLPTTDMDDGNRACVTNIFKLKVCVAKDFLV
jgi:hypothetical protein